MRHLIAIVAVCCGLQAIVSAQAPGTASELADDVLSGALWRIAVATHTRIGFESVDFVRLRGGLKDVPAFPISSRDEALKAAVDADPRYCDSNLTSGLRVGACGNDRCLNNSGI